MLYVFFFFKQKTAYEMRISDWSSDVCSSDLLLDQADPLLHRQRRAKLGVDVAAYRHVEDVKPREQQPRQEAAQEQLADRLLRHHGKQDGEDRGRDQDAERADRKSTRLNSSH